MVKKKILAISGSTRSKSTNLNLINAIADLFKDQFEVRIYEGMAELPQFNPDLDLDIQNAPGQVSEFRRQLKEADGILICTPEYAMGVPGSLKNAIDWTVSSCEFSHKPVALITASSLGEKGHASLLETLRIIESKITDETQLLISYAKVKVSSDAKIVDEETLAKVRKLISAFNRIISS